MKKDQIIHALTSRWGKDNKIYSAELEREFNVSGTEIRDIVRELRREGFPIIGGNGYYCSHEDIDILWQDLESRAMSMLQTVKESKEKYLSKYKEKKQIKLF